MARTRVRTHVVHGKNGTYTRHYHSRQTRDGKWQRTDRNGKPLKQRRRPKPKHRFKPQRALRNAKRAYRAAKRNKGWTFLLWSSAASTEILAFSIFRGGGALLSVAGVGLGGLGAAMKRRAE